jgi:hypothetical protein
MSSPLLAGHLVETLTVVIDAKGWRLGLATLQAYAFLRYATHHDRDLTPQAITAWGRNVEIMLPTAGLVLLHDEESH